VHQRRERGWGLGLGQLGVADLSGEVAAVS
jgi:hypothetical protein